MNRLDKVKLLKAIGTLTLLTLGVILLTKIHQRNSLTLDEYARQNAALHPTQSTEDEDLAKPTPDDDSSAEQIPGSTDSPEHPSGSTDSTGQVSDGTTPANPASDSSLIGATLNGSIFAEGDEPLRVTYADAFYYEPLSDDLKRYITGVSYPSAPDAAVAITLDELSYLHLLHVDFEGNVAEGELICNSAIAQDLVEIFYELYENEYQIEKILLIDVYDGDDTASMEDNNTSCFNYRTVEGSDSLSRHALGLAVDINPFYNPYVTYPDGVETISPAGSESYADRGTNFPYKIDEDDLCYKLFRQHGFTWGGNWNSCKDYQHFQKK